MLAGNFKAGVHFLPLEHCSALALQHANGFADLILSDASSCMIQPDPKSETLLALSQVMLQIQGSGESAYVRTAIECCHNPQQANRWVEHFEVGYLLGELLAQNISMHCSTLYLVSQTHGQPPRNMCKDKDAAEESKIEPEDTIAAICIHTHTKAPSQESCAVLCILAKDASQDICRHWTHLGKSVMQAINQHNSCADSFRIRYLSIRDCVGLEPPSYQHFMLGLCSEAELLSVETILAPLAMLG